LIPARGGLAAALTLALIGDAGTPPNPATPAAERRTLEEPHRTVHDDPGARRLLSRADSPERDPANLPGIAAARAALLRSGIAARARGAARWTIVAVLTLNLLLILQLAGMRSLRDARERRRAAFGVVVEPLLMQAMAGQPARRFVVHPGDGEHLLRLWNRYREIVSGDMADRLDAFGRRAGIGLLARRLLARKAVRDKILALATLGHLRDASAWNEIRQVAASRNAYLSLAAVSALAWIDPQAAAPIIVPLIAAREDWSTARVVALLRGMGAAIVSGPLAAAAVKASPPAATRLVRCLKEAGEPGSALPAVRRILETAADQELISACLQALARFADPADLGRVRGFLEHPAWYVRMHAVTALAGMATREDEERIVQLLSDREWWVRYRAAQAVAILPGMDAGRLAALKGRIGDPYGRDILEQAIAERGLR
jgi:HEAT repeat protein